MMAAMAALLLLSTQVTEGTKVWKAQEARTMLDRAVAAVKQDKTKALAMFNSGEGGFKDRDLYVLCANASDGIITASPTKKGASLKNFPSGEKVMKTATEGTVHETTYRWASSRHCEATQEAHILHQGGRSDLRCWLLGVIVSWPHQPSHL
jgi:hypothetical protein